MNRAYVQWDIQSCEFYSQVDEDFFFDWIFKSSPAIEIKGEGNIIRLKIPYNISTSGLRELLAFGCRYNLKMTDLIQFSREERFSWINDETKFWHAPIFNR